MRNVKSVFGKVFVSVMLVLGLTAASCNQRSSDVRVREDQQETEDSRIRDRQDSVGIERDQRMDEDVDKSTQGIDNTGQGGRVGTNNPDNRTMNSTNSSTNRGTNQGNDNSVDTSSRRR